MKLRAFFPRKIDEEHRETIPWEKEATEFKNPLELSRQ
jgi:hypothetical protein